MKFLAIVFVAFLVAAQGERLCRNKCQDTSAQDDGTSRGCQCDAACVDAEDCCGSYFDFCSDDAGCRNNCGSDQQSSDAGGRCFCDDACDDASDCCDDYAAECGGETDDTACQGCPDGAQTSTSGSDRGSCYCDAACVDSGDCCPSFTKYCGDAIVSESRQSFCALLASSKGVFCDTAMRKAYYFKVVSKINTTFTPKSGSGSEGWAPDTYKRTCLLEPEIVEEEAITCDSNIRGFNWRYGCTGLNSVWAQRCESPSCRDRDCDAPWRRDYWGATSMIADLMDPKGTSVDPDHPEFPKRYGRGQSLGVASQAGRCSMSFTNRCDNTTSPPLPEDSDRASAWVYGCLDTTYDADDVEFLDWENAYDVPYFTDIGIYGNEDSIESQIDDINRAWTASTKYRNGVLRSSPGKGEGYIGIDINYNVFASYGEESNADAQAYDSCP